MKTLYSIARIVNIVVVVFFLKTFQVLVQENQKAVNVVIFVQFFVDVYSVSFSSFINVIYKFYMKNK